jgi:hypothetical protein
MFGKVSAHIVLVLRSGLPLTHESMPHAKHTGYDYLYPTKLKLYFALHVLAAPPSNSETYAVSVRWPAVDACNSCV